VAQCSHEGETRAVLLRKKGLVRRCSVPVRAFHAEFLSEGTRQRSFKSGRALYPGSAISGKNIRCSYGLCPRDPGKRALKAGKRYIRRALYPSSPHIPLYKILYNTVSVLNKDLPLARVRRMFAHFPRGDIFVVGSS